MLPSVGHVYKHDPMLWVLGALGHLETLYDFGLSFGGSKALRGF